MSQFTHFIMRTLLVMLVVLISSNFVTGQVARKNGRGTDRLDPIGPTTEEFRERRTTDCPETERLLNGTCTNSNNPVAGSTSLPLFSYFPNTSSKKPTGTDLRSARFISNVMSSQPDGLDIFDPRGVSEFLVFFGQFLDHTIVATTTRTSTESMPIDIPSDDPIMANFSSGKLPFNRNVRTGVFGSLLRGGSERAINTLPSAIDLVSIYGPDEARADFLRSFKDGKLKVSASDLPPFNNGNFFNSPSSSSRFFLSGDHRVNEHPTLTAFHALFIREHNKLADELKAAFPEYTDAELFDMARKINIAQYQKIVYEEFYPAITGRSFPAYRGFQPNVDPSISIEFSVAGFRIGHTMVGHQLTLRGVNNAPLPSIPAKSLFFNPMQVKNIGIDPFLRGSIFQKAQKVDTLVTDTLRNFLFTNVGEESGFDLIALNIQRSRDLAAPRYNKLRRFFERRRATTMAEITSDVNVQSKLSNAYQSPNDVEAWIGLMAEDHMAGSSMGPTMFALWEAEFKRMRDGDRFFYQARDLFDDEFRSKFPRLSQIYNGRDTMTQILLRNTGITKQEIGANPWITSR